MANYKLKRVPFGSVDVSIVLQNENGPCPLIAVANVLILRGQLKVLAQAPDISQDRLMALVAEHLLDINLAVDETSRYAADLRQNLQDVISILPKLATGVDVNPKFDSIRGFEFTHEIAIFDLMNVSLVHGWLVDPQNETFAGVLRNQSYNQIVSRLVAMLGTQAPKHLVTPQSSFGSVTPNTKEMPETSNASTTIVTRSGSAVTGDTTRPTTEVPSSGAAQDLILLDDFAFTLPITIQKPAEPKGDVECVTGPEKHWNPDATGGEKVSDSKTYSTVAPASPSVEDNLSDLNLAQGKGLRQVTGATSDTVVLSSAFKECTGNETLPVQSVGTSGCEEGEGEQENAAFIKTVQDFLESTSSQLTLYGLYQLHEGLKNHELAVLFRNNHFNTLYKHQGELYILVTDQGYMSEDELVWEKLDAVDGDTQYFTYDFLPYTKTEGDPVALAEDLDLQRVLEESASSGQGARGAATPGFLPPDFLSVTTDVPQGQQLSQPVQKRLRPCSTMWAQPNEDADLALAIQMHEEMLWDQQRERNEANLQQEHQERLNTQLAVGHPARGIQYSFPPVQLSDELPERNTYGGAQRQAYGYPAQSPTPAGQGAAIQQQRQGYVPTGPGVLGGRQEQQERQHRHQHSASSPMQKLWCKLTRFLRR